MDSKDILDEFLWNIKIGNYGEVIKHMTKTFRSHYSRIQLLDWAESCIPFKIVSYEILEQIERKDGVNPEVLHTYRVEFIDPEGMKLYSTPNVICEDKPYRASKKGQWGVNPISAIPKNLKGSKQKEICAYAKKQ